MSFFKVSTKEEDVKSSSSNYINESGLFPVTLLAPVVSVSNNGSTSIDLFVEYNGQKQIIYGNLRITNNDGSENVIGSRLFNQLLVVAGVDDVADPVDMELPIGKGGKDKVCAVLEDLMDIDVIIRIELEYGMYNGNIQERRNIRGFYREDEASAQEIVSGEDVGSQYSKDKRYEGVTTYRDGLTAENIQQWVTDGRTGSGGTSGGGETKAPNFRGKRFNKK
jgi:hypothetical protein